VVGGDRAELLELVDRPLPGVAPLAGHQVSSGCVGLWSIKAAARTCWWPVRRRSAKSWRWTRHRCSTASPCLVDAADQECRERLAGRRPGMWDQSAVDSFVGWAAWHRGHARDPRFQPEVLVAGTGPDPARHRGELDRRRSAWPCNRRDWLSDDLEAARRRAVHRQCSSNAAPIQQ
jgi:hypothetical protein